VCFGLKEKMFCFEAYLSSSGVERCRENNCSLKKLKNIIEAKNYFQWSVELTIFITLFGKSSKLSTNTVMSFT
jgi:hypothetical protein